MGTIHCTKCGAENTEKAKYCSECGYEMPKRMEASNDEVVKQVPKKDKKSISVAPIAGAILSILLIFAVQHFVFKQPSFDKSLMALASELNKTCPVMVDQETRFDNAVSMPGKVLQYNYTLINYNSDQVNVEELIAYLKPIMINTIKTSPQMKELKEMEVTFAYYYKDKTAKFLFKITVTPDMYK